VLATESLVDHQGAAIPGAEQLFAYGAGKRFTLTGPGSSPEGVALPAPMHGVVALDGTFFAVAQEDPAAPALQAAAYRYQEAGFDRDAIEGGRFAYVQVEALVDGANRHGGATVGHAVFDPSGTVLVAG
jgi:hypothetical protein